MEGEKDLIVGNFVLVNTASFSITRDGITKSKIEYDLQKVREVIVGLYNMVL